MNVFSFKNLVGFTSFFIATCAAYFSIIGIAMLFSGSMVAAIIMASSLELGKLVATSYLFRYWESTKSFLKIYLTIGVVVLMFITSLGIFGYLSSAYQKSSLENSTYEEKIAMYESQKLVTQSKIEQSKSRILTIDSLRVNQEKRLNDSMTNTFLARNPIQLQEIQTQTLDLITNNEKNIELENQKIQSSNEELLNLQTTINNVKVESRSKSDIITFKYVSDEFNVPMDTIVKWFIALLISVFDPLAICLLLAYNNILFTDDKKKNYHKYH